MFLCIALTSCGGNILSENKDEPISTGSIYGLTHEKIIQYEELSKKNGDSSASFRLYMYYLLSKYDPPKAETWLNISANQNHPVAQYNLAQSHFENKNFDEAIFWANKAIANGSIKAKELIEQIGQIRN